MTPTPFVDGAGGKTQLLSQYDAHLPATFWRYIEPFGRTTDGVGLDSKSAVCYNRGRLPRAIGQVMPQGRCKVVSSWPLPNAISG
jgi:hypothetical protein